MSVAHYEGIMENLMFIQQMYIHFRNRAAKNKNRSHADKMETQRKANAIVKIMNEIDLRLYIHQRGTGFLESGNIEIYRISRKGYLKVFDIVSVNGAVKGLESKAYTSKLRKQVVGFVKSRFVKPEPSAPPLQENYIDKDGRQIFYHGDSYIDV